MREYANHLLHMCNHVLIPPKIILLSSCLFVFTKVYERLAPAHTMHQLGIKLEIKLVQGHSRSKNYFVELCMLISEVLLILA